MPKSSKRPSKASKPKTAKRRSNTEPEVLGGDDEAPRSRTRSEQVNGLDELVTFLAAQDRPFVVAYAIAEVYGGKWSPDRELAVLKLIKADARFVISTADRKSFVALAAAKDAAATKAALDDAKEAAAGENAAAASSAAEPAAKTIAEHLQDAQGRPLRIPWPADVGSHVLLLTDGHAPRKATIRNIKTVGSASFYDLNTDNGGTCDEVPAYRIGRDPEADGVVAQLRERLAMEQRHRERGKGLADLYALQQASEKELAESLSDHRKNMAETARRLADHARTDPGQQDLRDIIGDGSAPAAKPRQAKKDAPPSADEDKLADQPAHEPGVISLEATGLTLDELMAARFEQGTASTGKPQQVKPVKLAGEDRVIVDVQAGRAVALLAVPKRGWAALYAEKFGEPLKLPSDAPSLQLAIGGRWCGMPVKVGRATCYLGAVADALFVQLPAEAEKPVGKDAAAGG